MKEHAFCPVETYGFSEGADWRGEVTGVDAGRQSLVITYQGVPYTTLSTTLTGRHNLQNVLAAVAMGHYFGLSATTNAEGIGSFKGVKRRMETFLEAGGVTYIDDFAHHPTAIAETIAGAKTRWPDQRLRVLFEPRSNTTVTNRFFDELHDAFKTADEVHLGPIYRGESIPDGERLDRERLVEGLRASGCDAAVWDDPTALAREIKETAKSGDIVLILSNGAFGGIYEAFRQGVSAG